MRNQMTRIRLRPPVRGRMGIPGTAGDADRRNGRSASRIPAWALLLPVAILMVFQPAQAQPARQREEMRDDLRETVEIYMLARMKRELELDETQERTIIPLIEQMNASRREFHQERRRIVSRLQPLVEEGGSDPGIRGLLDELYRIEAEHRDAEERTLAAVRGNLTSGQEARFLFFMERFRREMEDRVRGMMQGGPPGPRRIVPPRGSGPGRERPDPRR